MASIITVRIIKSIAHGTVKMCVVHIDLTDTVGALVAMVQDSESSSCVCHFILSHSRQLSRQSLIMCASGT